MKQPTALILVLTLLLAYSQAQDVKIIRTQTFGRYDYHEIPQLEGDSLFIGFLIAGYLILGVALIVSMILVWRDELQRHKDYAADVERARDKMIEMNMDVDKIEADFQLVQKGIDPNEEQEGDEAFNPQ